MNNDRQMWRVGILYSIKYGIFYTFTWGENDFYVNESYQFRIEAELEAFFIWPI